MVLLFILQKLYKEIKLILSLLFSDLPVQGHLAAVRLDHILQLVINTLAPENPVSTGRLSGWVWGEKERDMEAERRGWVHWGTGREGAGRV